MKAIINIDVPDWQIGKMVQIFFPDSMQTYGTCVLLKEQEAVVRCKDCKHLFNGEHTENCCDVLMEKADWQVEISVNPDWFCADGE